LSLKALKLPSDAPELLRRAFAQSSFVSSVKMSVGFSGLVRPSYSAFMLFSSWSPSSGAVDVAHVMLPTASTSSAAHSMSTLLCCILRVGGECGSGAGAGSTGCELVELDSGRDQSGAGLCMIGQLVPQPSRLHSHHQLSDDSDGDNGSWCEKSL